MDPVIEIKARLSIEDLVGQYCQLQKKGRTLKCVCPFHNDTHPSMTVSPDKGIAYCFACQSGGDIFSFYQKIEGVDFRQALKDLAEKTGVTLEDQRPENVTNKDEKERLRECLQAAISFYRSKLAESDIAKNYLLKRAIPSSQIELFSLGYAPDSFSQTYEFLLKRGFSKSEILKAGLAVQKDLGNEKMYDRFRNRLMFPIFDAQGKPVAFGGRTLGDDDAKYINSSEGPLYRKSSVLFGFHLAKDAMREKADVVMVEGYFDLLACHRVGVTNVVAVSGTALTEEHVKILKRSCDSVTLCLDQDRAGKDAAERAFHLCSAEGMLVRAATIGHKDPDEAANADPEALKRALIEEAVPYLDTVLRDIAVTKPVGAQAKRDVLLRIIPLLKSLPTAVEREHYCSLAAAVLGTTTTALMEDIEAGAVRHAKPAVPVDIDAPSAQPVAGFSKAEIVLGLVLMYPDQAALLKQLIEPEEGFASAVYRAIGDLAEGVALTTDALDIDQSYQERAKILMLFCEDHGMTEWNETVAAREIRKNIAYANRHLLERKQREIAADIVAARRDGKRAEEEMLNTKYQQVLKLVRMSGS